MTLVSITALNKYLAPCSNENSNAQYFNSVSKHLKSPACYYLSPHSNLTEERAFLLLVPHIFDILFRKVYHILSGAPGSWEQESFHRGRRMVSCERPDFGTPKCIYSIMVCLNFAPLQRGTLCRGTALNPALPYRPVQASQIMYTSCI